MDQELMDVLLTPNSRALFRAHLVKEYCDENLLFWEAVQEYKDTTLLLASASTSSAASQPSTKSAALASVSTTAAASTSPATSAATTAAATPTNDAAAYDVPKEEQLRTVLDKAKEIYKTYMMTGCEYQVNLESSVLRRAQQQLDQAETLLQASDGSVPDNRLNEAHRLLCGVLDKPQAQIFSLMTRDAFPRFQKQLRQTQLNAELLLSPKERANYFTEDEFVKKEIHLNLFRETQF